MKDLTEQEEIDNILSATTQNEYQHKKFKERIEKFNLSAEPSDWFDYRKTHIELFYGVPASSGIIALDKAGQYRKKVRRFESIMSEPALSKEDLATRRSSKDKNLLKTRLELIPDYRLGPALLYQLFSLTPIFQDGKFDPAVVFSTYHLVEFAEVSTKFRKLVQGQFDVPTRMDVDRKPVLHLGKLLELVGLKIIKVGENRKGKIKTRFYSITPTHLGTMESVTSRRAVHNFPNPNIGWPYVNKLHDFQYLDEEMDWLYSRK